MKGVFGSVPVSFVGSHPMAGSELAGMSAARPDLYDGAVVVVTPGGDEGHALEKVCRFWRRVGAKVVLMDPEQHDRIVARTSHFPHLMAAMLVHAALRSGPGTPDVLVGAGFRDTTRVAAGAEQIWLDILRTNRDALLKELREMERVMAKVRGLLNRRDFAGLRRFLEAARLMRESLNQTG